MRTVGDMLRRAGVAAVYLVHGTFVGTDALGVLSKLEPIAPSANQVFRRWKNAFLDAAIGESGNYTREMAKGFQDAMHRDGAAVIPVHRFHWSSQNNHISRADAAVRLIKELDGLNLPHGRRILLWGHSHAGNAFAIMTNLIAANDRVRRQFFRAARSYYRWPVCGCVDVPVWPWLQRRLEEQPGPMNGVKLDLVTFGTPIRYGWDTNGYSKLLHFVNHRPPDGRSPQGIPFPPRWERILDAADGDYVQQLAIAGTDFPPSVLAWRSCQAECRLNRLLQPGLRRRDLANRLKYSNRVSDEGTTLLVDYGPPAGRLAQHHAGHAVYTRSEWLLFHAEQTAQCFY